MSDSIIIPRSLFSDKTLRAGKVNVLFAFIDLISLAETEDTQVNIRGQILTVHRGEIATSVRALAKRWGWSVHTVISELNKLEVAHRIERRNNNVTSIISVSNYQSFIMNCNAECNTECNAESSSRTRVIDDSISGDLELFDNIPPTHKQESKDSVCSAPQGAKAKRSVFVPPTLHEVQRYCFENSLMMDPAEFFDHFTSNGWMVGGKSKMKDWKAAARNWARNQKRFNKAPEPQVENPAYKRPPIKYIKPEYDPNYKAQ